MAFGDSAKKNASAKKEFKPTENVFLDIKRGTRIFRVLGDELRYKVIWVAKESDGTWIPKFGYNPSDRREARPITVSVYNHSTDEWDGDAYNNPLMQWVNDNFDEDAQKDGKMYPKEQFYVNVMDRTPVKIDAETVYYPDPKNQFPENLKGIPAKVLNAIKILQGSSGKVRDEDGDVVGKHLYADLLRVVEGGEVNPDTGNLLMPHEYDIRLVTTGTGKETERKFSITANREVLDLSEVKIYDLRGWLKPYPTEFMREILLGADFNESLKNYKIKLYPDLVPYSGATTEDDIPF